MMKSVLLLSLMIGAVHAVEVKAETLGSVITENIPPVPASLVAKLNAYQNVRSASFADWLPGNKGMLIQTRFGNTSQVHLVETPKGMRRQLTFFSEPAGGWGVCPDTTVPYFLIGKDSAGNELYQYYKFNYQTGDHGLLTDGVSRHGSCAWSNRGDRFAFSSTARNGRDYDLYLGDLSGHENFKILAEREGMWFVSEWSPDDKKILVGHYVSDRESYYYIFDIAKRRFKQVNAVKRHVKYGGARWARDGKGLYLLSDQYGEFMSLQFYDIVSTRIKVMTGSIPWDVDEFDLSQDGSLLAFTTNENGSSRLHLMDTRTIAIATVAIPMGLCYGLRFRRDGTSLAMVLNRPKAQSDVYTLDLSSKDLIRWTYSENAWLDTTAFVEPKLFYYQTFDSTDGRPRLIPAYIYRPKRNSVPAPVLIDIHGGPTGQSGTIFSPLFQYYVKELGIAVISPNIRGSSGYGKTYVLLDNGYNRESAVKDVGKLLDWIGHQPDLDAGRVGVIGGSYGGYMALACLTHYSNRLVCGIDGWGISNFVTFLQSTAEYRRDLRRAEYGDERDPAMREFLKKISPLNNASSITVPLFVAQGKNDPRVPVSEAEQIVDAVRMNGVDVWYFLAEDEGHGFGKKQNRDFYNQAVSMFLDKYLIGNDK